MALARVWNDNSYPHTEEFKGKVITIAPKESVTMDYEEAIEFKSQYTPIVTDGEKVPKQENKKMIRVEILGDAHKAPLPLVCHATGKAAATESELRAMNAQHADMLADPESAKKADDVEMLKAQLAEQSAQIQQLLALAAEKQSKGPGRPKKQV